MSLTQEYFTEDEWEHGWYCDYVKSGYKFIKDAYLKIMNTQCE